MYSLQFSKNFPLPQNGGHFEFSNFCPKWQNTNLLLSPYRAISSISSKFSTKFSTHRVSKECTLCNFPKIFPSPKMAAILNFRIFAQNGKTQICFYLLNRAISSKFSTHRVSKECTLCNFQKIFPSPKMAAILIFRIFAKNGKTQICFYLLNRAR